MNRTGKSKIIMIVSLSVLLIAQMIIFLLTKKESSTAILMMFGFIVLLALVGVALSFYQLKVLKDRISLLPEAYKTVYIDAQESVNLSNLSKGMKQDIKAAILEIFEHSALDNRDVESVINGDLNKFIEPFISAGGGNFNGLYLYSYSTSLFIGYILFMKLYKIFKFGFTVEAIEKSTLDLGIIISYAIIAFIFVPWLMYIMRKAAIERWSTVKRLWILCPIMLPIGLLFILIGIDNEAFRGFLDTEIPLLDSPMKLAFASFVFAVSIFLVKLTRKKQLNC